MNETSGRVEQKKLVSQSEEMELEEERGGKKNIFKEPRTKLRERISGTIEGVRERVCERKGWGM